MKQRLLLTFVGLLSILDSFSQVYQTDWAYEDRMQTTSSLEGSSATSITTDQNGDFFSVGTFSGTIDFDPDNNNTSNLNSIGTGLGVEKSSIFIQKVTSQKSLVWAKKIERTSSITSRIYVYSIKADLNNIYITGGFEGQVDFDPSTTGTQLRGSSNNSSSFDAFVLILNKTTGNYVNVFILAGPGQDAGATLSISNNSIYVAGYFENSITINATNTITSNGSKDFYLLSLTTSGGFNWIKSFGSSSNDIYQEPSYDEKPDLSIANDASGNIYLAGTFTSTFNVIPSNNSTKLTSLGYYTDIFYLKYLSNGSIVWVKQVGGNTEDRLTAIILKGNFIYSTGSFTTIADFDPAITSNTNAQLNTNNTSTAGSENGTMFVSKIDLNGTFQWAKKIQGITASSFSLGRAITSNSCGNELFFTGRFKGTCDFDPNGNISNLTSTSTLVNLNNSFILSLDINGNYIFSKLIGGTGNVTGLDICSSNLNDIYTSGYFRGTINFNTESTPQNITTYNNYNEGFVHKLKITCPTITVNSTSICQGQSTTLTATLNPVNNNGTYLWSNGATTPSITVNPNSTTTYTVTFTPNCCPAISATATVTVNPAPIITVNSATICSGSSTTLNAVPNTTGGTYVWTPGGSTGTVSSLTVSPSSTTTYACVYSVNGCSSLPTSGTVTVVNSSITIPNKTICQGANTTLTATPVTLGGTYLWSTGETTPSISVSPNVTTSYSCIYTVNGCSSPSTNVTVTVTPLPTVTLNPVTICAGSSATLTAVPNITGGTYVWSPGGSTGTVGSLTVTPATTTTYSLVYTKNCPSLPTNVTVTVVPKPTVSISPVTVCQGLPATLIPVISQTGGSYSWNTLPSSTTTPTLTVTPTATTNYTLTFNNGVCPSQSATGTVTVTPLPIITVNSPTVCQGQSAILTATPNILNGTYSWNTTPTQTSASISLTPTTTTTYSCVYTAPAPNGCTSLPISGTVSVKTDGTCCTNPEPGLQWDTQLGTTGTSIGYAYGTSVKNDAFGNVYSTGYFKDNVLYNTGGTAYNLIPKGPNSYDIYVMKQDALGNVLWAQTIGGSLEDMPLSLDVDINGDVIVVGKFNGSVNFNPNVTPSTTLVSNGLDDQFVFKLSGSNGSLVWANAYGGIESDILNSVIADNNGNIYITGKYGSTVNFGGTSLTSLGGSDAVVMKLNPNGTPASIINSYGGGHDESGNSIVVDGSGNIIITGDFSGSVTIGGTTILPVGSMDVFVLKLNSIGTPIWTKTIGGTGNDYGRSITVDNMSNIYTTGQIFMTNTAYFVGNLYPTAITGADHMYVLKLDPNGLKTWLNITYGHDLLVPNSIVNDPCGDVYVIGDFNSSFDMNYSPLTNILTNGSTDIFIQKLESENGLLLWGKTFGGTGRESGRDLCVDQNYNVFTTGLFQSTVDFNPSASYTNNMSSFYTDAFVQKFNLTSPKSMSITEDQTKFNNSKTQSKYSISIAPNPTNNKFNIELNDVEAENIIVYNMLGKVVFENRNESKDSTVEVDLSDLPSGIYMVNINTGSEIISKKVIKN